MANGFHGTDEEWVRLAKPLESLDPILEKFASSKDIPLGKNTKNWPDRELRWVDSLHRLIQIYLQNEKELTWTLWICAYQLEERDHIWQHETIINSVSIQELKTNLGTILEEAWSKVSSWTTDDLVPSDTEHKF